MFSPEHSQGVQAKVKLKEYPIQLRENLHRGSLKRGLLKLVGVHVPIFGSTFLYPVNLNIMKTVKTKRVKEWVNIRIERDIYTNLKAMAKRRGESLTQLVQALLEKK